jgi:hypothetical protein
MVLAGVRQDGDRHIFLVQNWWAHKQFFEVDEAYLQSSNTSFVFVKTPQPNIREEFQRDVRIGFTLRVSHDLPLRAQKQGPIPGAPYFRSVPLHVQG